MVCLPNGVERMSIEKLVLESNRPRNDQIIKNRNKAFFLGLFTLGTLGSFALWLIYSAMTVADNITVPSPWH